VRAEVLLCLLALTGLALLALLRARISRAGSHRYIPARRAAQSGRTSGARDTRIGGTVGVLAAVVAFVTTAVVVAVAMLSPTIRPDRPSEPDSASQPGQRAAAPPSGPPGGATATPSQPRTFASLSSRPSSSAMPSSAGPTSWTPVLTTPFGEPAVGSQAPRASSATAATPTRADPEARPSPKPGKTVVKPSHPAPPTSPRGPWTSKPKPTVPRGKH